MVNIQDNHNKSTHTETHTHTHRNTHTHTHTDIYNEQIHIFLNPSPYQQLKIRAFHPPNYLKAYLIVLL